jgi:hypothetical protein
MPDQQTQKKPPVAATHEEGVEAVLPAAIDQPPASSNPKQPGPPKIEDYVPGAKDEYGLTIKSVIGKHRHLVVYITDNDRAGWRYHELPEWLRPAVAEFQRLTGLARSSLGKKNAKRAALLLAQSLYAAFLSTQGSNLQSHFLESSTFIREKATQATRLLYTFLTVVCGIIAVSLAFTVYEYWPNHEDLRRALAVAVAGGVIGALVSVMQRLRDLDIDPLDSRLVLVLNGVIRLGLGACFGFLFVVAVKANIVLGHFAHEPWALLGLAAGAGFTERWVPELLGHHSP